MKTCKSCGAVNKDESCFCSSCGSSEFQPVAAAPVPPINPGFYVPPKPEYTVYDLLTIFGFVASIIGLFWISLILEPIALISAVMGFKGSKKRRALAAAAIIISIIGLLIRLFITLYNNGVIPQWLVSGIYF